jgi:hypothetical protein
VRRGRKYQEKDGSWVLTSKRGTEIARFATEVELDAYWQKLQFSQGRQPEPLVQGKAPTRGAVPARRKRRGVAPRTSGGNGALGSRSGSDFLKPWSDEYGMPEYDLE